MACSLGVLSCGEAPKVDAAPRKPSPGCRAPAGVSNMPRSVAETVSLVNALPKPLSLPCFVESLARPLEVHATRSVFSAQPATGKRSPRIFLFLGPNIVSIVPEGVGTHLLEFGEQREDHRSLKAEIEFPVTHELTPEAPYERLLFSENFTGCAFCHAQEDQDLAIPNVRAFVSQALRPVARDHVGIDVMQAELLACDAEVEAGRCAMLDALLSWGTLIEASFPEDMATFGN